MLNDTDTINVICANCGNQQEEQIERLKNQRNLACNNQAGGCGVPLENHAEKLALAVANHAANSIAHIRLYPLFS